MVKPKIGVLMLNTVFPRLVGDIGRDETFPFEVERYYVKNATSKSVVLSDEDICQNFIDGAINLQEKGCMIITTSCGFLIKYQERISNALKVPFISSGLLLFDFLLKICPRNSEIGILTASIDNLTKMKTDSCNIEKIIKCAYGMEETYFYRVYVKNEITDEQELDIDQLYKDLCNKVSTMLKEHSYVSAIILECTNMVPFKKRLIEEFEIPIYDINSLIAYVLENYK